MYIAVPSHVLLWINPVWKTRNRSTVILSTKHKLSLPCVDTIPMFGSHFHWCLLKRYVLELSSNFKPYYSNWKMLSKYSLHFTPTFSVSYVVKPLMFHFQLFQFPTFLLLDILHFDIININWTVRICTQIFGETVNWMDCSTTEKLFALIISEFHKHLRFKKFIEYSYWIRIFIEQNILECS